MEGSGRSEFRWNSPPTTRQSAQLGFLTLGLYSTFLAWNAMVFKSSLQSRFTVATLFLCVGGYARQGCVPRGRVRISDKNSADGFLVTAGEARTVAAARCLTGARLNPRRHLWQAQPPRRWTGPRPRAGRARARCRSWFPPFKKPQRKRGTNLPPSKFTPLLFVKHAVSDTRAGPTGEPAGIEPRRRRRPVPRNPVPNPTPV